jgi:hypothetical protein
MIALQKLAAPSNTTKYKKQINPTLQSTITAIATRQSNCQYCHLLVSPIRHEYGAIFVTIQSSRTIQLIRFIAF